MKKLLYVVLSCLLLLILISPSAAALDKSDVLGYSFSGDKRYLRLFVIGDVTDKETVTIVKKNIKPEIKKNVEIRTTFLIDNTGSFPRPMRDPVKKAIVSYMRQMDTQESVRLATFDKTVTSLSEKYTRDAEYIAAELDSISFDQQSSYVYDCIKKAIEEFFWDDDAFYRLVIVTDGISDISGGSVSFDYLKDMIANNNNQHIDFIQVGGLEKPRENSNMKSLSMLSSNTFHLFYEGHSDIQYLVLKNVSLLKTPMNSELMTGEYKGIAVNDGSVTTDIGRAYFAHAEWPTESSDASPNVGTIVAIVLSVIGAVVLISIGVFFIVRMNSRIETVIMTVNVIKEDQRDTDGINDHKWIFPKDKGFRVGRTLHPVDQNGKTMGTNDYAIIETAVPSQKTGIGRNAFEIKYKNTDKCYIIRNIAQKARFSIYDGKNVIEVGIGAEQPIVRGIEILLGYYTTIRIDAIETKKCTSKELKKLRGD